MLTYTTLCDKIERMDKRIEELANQVEYHEPVQKLSCFIGIKNIPHYLSSLRLAILSVLQMPNTLHLI